MNFNGPVEGNKYFVSEPTLGNTERAFLLQAFDSGWISSSGDFVKLAEEKLSEQLEAESVSLCSNGTVALHLALLALEIAENDEVLVPNLSYVAVPNSVLYVNATPILVDINPFNFSIDLNHAEKLITKRTKAIIVVHNYGLMCDMKKVLDFAKKHNLFVIEDCAEAPFLGKLWGDSHMKTYSFYGNKIVTSGEGGAIASNNPELISRINILKNQGVNKSKKFEFNEIGYNYRLTNLQAAVLFGQMSNLEENLLKRYLIFEAYNEAFLNTSGIKVLYNIPRNNYSPWLYSLLLDAHLDRDRVIYLLQKNGIETRPFFAPHSESGRFKPDQKCNFQNSISISNSGINLPTYSHLAHTDIKYIARVAKSIFAL